MPKMMRWLCCGLAALLVYTNVARADLENENFLVAIPPGYKIDFQQRKNNLHMTEMVPVNETVNDWTEMVTVQMFLGMKNLKIEQYRSRMEQLWYGSCAGATSKTISQDSSRGLPSSMWVLLCPLNRGTGKPENTWFKAIQGVDSFYAVQKAHKFTPSKEQENKWLAYLNEAVVCDSRVSERACPKMKP